ncbi:hypothetical protein BC749_101162 [Flavobacterium araucananum]|nr:hypothetical protein [Flavobacterium araucananum]PWK02102.1 hypothetical protein BC749_101162 [Flavobacterium araucananum]
MGTEYITKVKNIYKEIKSYDYNPIYQVRYENYDCPMELYINDVLVVYLAGGGRTAGEQIIQVPQYILKSGIQTTKVKIYPLLDTNKNFEKFVSRDTQLKLRITYQDYEREKNGKYTEVMKFKLPKIDKDLPFVELEGKFTATVPYTLEGWSEGIDLSKEDPLKLEAEVKGRMNEIADLYRNKDIEGLAREQYSRSREIEQSFYSNTKENSEELITELQDGLKESIKTEVLEGKMKLMANGKLVTILINKGPFFNKAIIRDKLKEGFVVYPQYFYRPRPGAKLEIIR